MLTGSSTKNMLDMSFFLHVISLIRVKHWIKNGFVFLPLLISKQYLELELISNTIMTFVAFCGAASAIYIINDLADVEKDKKHPVKKNRAIASGKISVPQAILIKLTITVSVVYFLRHLPAEACGIILVYFALNLTYSIMLKHEVFIDVFTIATGFVLRVVAGGFAIGWSTPLWLILVTFFLCLFLALGKRRHELLYTDKKGGSDHRPVLAKYNEKLLDSLIIVSATLTLGSYSLFVVEIYAIILSFPFILYGMFRYLHIVYMQNDGGDPSSSIIKDKPLIISVILWLALVYSVLILTN